LGSLEPPPLEIENGDLADPANMYLPYGLPCRQLCGSETTEPIRMKFVRVWLRYPSDSTSQIWREQRRRGGEGRLRRWICIHKQPTPEKREFSLKAPELCSVRFPLWLYCHGVKSSPYYPKTIFFSRTLSGNWHQYCDVSAHWIVK